MTMWFTADWHLGHTNMAIRRGYLSSSAHDDALYDFYCFKVKPEDIVYFLGDMAMTRSKARLTDMFQNVKDLPGRKRLITGNHDANFPGSRTAYKYSTIYNDVFESVAPFGRIKYNQTQYLLSHFPYDGDSGSENRFNQFRLRDEDLSVIHGHTHSKDKRTLSEFGNWQLHCGVDAWNMEPVSIMELDRLTNENA